MAQESEVLKPGKCQFYCAIYILFLEGGWLIPFSSMKYKNQLCEVHNKTYNKNIE